MKIRSCRSVSRRGVPIRATGRLLALACAGTVQAATVTWTGAANDGNWKNAANWSPAGVPALGDTANIPGGLATLYPLVGNAATITAVNVNSASTGASVTVVAGGTFDVRGALTVNVGGLFAQTGGTSLLSGGLTVSGAGLQSGGLMHFGPNAGAAPGGKLNIKSGGTVSQSGGTMAIRDLNSSAGSSYSQSGSALLKVFHDYRNKGTFDATAGTIEFAGTGGGKSWDTGATGIHRFFHVAIDAGVTETFDGKTTPTIHVRGGWTNNGSAALTSKATTVIFDGANDQDIAGASVTAFRNLVVDKASGELTLKINATVATSASGSGTLTLQRGTITTGPNTLTVYAGGTVSRPAGTPGHVVGHLRKFINTNGAVSRTYEVGTGADYTPMEVSIFGVSGAGTADETLTGSSAAGDHPALAASDINVARSVNRYWTLTKAGSWNFSSNNIVFHFVSGDVDAGANPANFQIRRHDGVNWNKASVGTRTPTSIQASNVTAYGDFAAGETNGADTVTATTLASSPDPSCVGVEVAFTATVSHAGSPVTAGTVRFIEGGTCESPGAVLAGPLALNVNGQAVLLTTNLGAGAHVIIACYTNGPGFDFSQGTVTQVVHAVPTCPIDGPASVCPNSTDVFSAPTGMAAYGWSVDGDAAISGSAAQDSVSVHASNVCHGSYTLMLNVTDTNGCSSQCESIVPVDDTTPPVLSGVPVDTSAECDAIPAPAIVGASDDCEVLVTVVFSETTNAGSCANSYQLVRVWSAGDGCGNGIAETQIVTVADTKAPVLTVPSDKVLSCMESANPTNAGTAAATDACDGSPDVSYVDAVTNGVITRTWTATDACGNSSSSNQVIVAVDSGDPDGDHVSNFDECIANTLPGDPQSYPRVFVLQTPPGNTVSFPSAVGRVYTIEYIDTITLDAWSVLQADIAGDGSLMFVPDPAGTPHRFYRLRIRLAP